MSRLIAFNITTGHVSILAKSFNQSTPNSSARFNIDLSFVWSLHYHKPSKNILMVDRVHGIIILNLVTGSEKIIGGTVEVSTNPNSQHEKHSIFSRPHGVCIKPNGNIIVADTANHMVKEINAKTFNVKVLAGKRSPGVSGDGNPGESSMLASPHDVAVNKNGEVFIADTGNHKIRKIDSLGIISTVAGSTNNENSIKKDPSVALKSSLKSPHSICFDNNFCLLISDTLNNRVCRVNFLENTFETMAGRLLNEEKIESCENIYPHGTAVDQENNLLIADRDNNKIRFVKNNSSVITTLIGETPSAKMFFPLDAPQAISTDLEQNIFVVDSNNS